MNVDAQILQALRGSPEGVSGADLAARLGITRAAVWGRIEELRQLGYEVDASPHRGYRLRSVPDVLHADDLWSRLGKVRCVGRDIRVFRETTSTNDVAEKLGHDGAAEGVVVFAESQTRGRGRMGRRWVSPSRRGLWFSALFRPRLRPEAVTQMTVLAAVSVARAIRIGTGLAVEIKWPNDLLLGGRKVAGILTEMSAEMDHVKHVILGVGIDVNQTAGEFPAELRATATSLRLACGHLVERPALAAVVLRELDADYHRLGLGGFAELADEWEAGCTTLGREVVVVVGERRVRGRAEALDSAGALLLRTEHGRLERVTGGDVTVLP
jgi:BirA family biotin operon repressor/biotin-[acetyl-CoA-carboxylase] ligase